MTPEELQGVYESLKQEGKSDADIVVGLGKMFEEGQISKEELKALIEPLGYEFTPEFEQAEGDDAKGELWKDNAEKPKEGVTEAEAEESEDEGEDTPTSANSKEEPKGEEPQPEQPNQESEEDEREKAFKAMGLR